MGYIEPVIPTPDCLAPENFDGEYVYDDETQTYGALLTWTAPETQPLHYNLYVTDPSGCTTTVEIDPVETKYFDETTIIGTVMYRLTAVYENCESDFALTPDGEDYIIIEMTSVSENDNDSEIVTLLKIYSTHGQVIHNANMGELSSGVYIVHGLTATGKFVTKKVVVNKE